MLRENCGRRGAAGSDFAGARVSAGSSAVVASRGGRPRAAGRRRGRATAWVWWYPREKVSQASVAARSTSISWPTFLRSQSPGFCDAFSSENCFQRFSPRAISILAGWARPLGGCWRGGPPPPRPDGGWPPDPRPPPLPRPEGGALFCIEVVVRGAAIASAVVGGGKATCSRRARDDGGRPGGAGGGGGGVKPPPRRRGSTASAPLGSPAGGVRGNSVARDLSQRYVCLANRAAAESARPTPPRRPQWRRRRRRRPPRAPLPPGGAAPARAAGRLAPARPSRASASVSALAASAPSGAARALGRLAPHKLRAKSVSTSARVL